jgi:hypothetical protein
MNERLIPFAQFHLDADGTGETDADSVGGGTYVPEGMLLTKVSHSLTLTGTPTSATIDIQDDGTDIAAAIDVSTAGIETLSAPVRIAAGSHVECDLNLAGGTTPKARGRVVLWGYVSE